MLHIFSLSKFTGELLKLNINQSSCINIVLDYIYLLPCGVYQLKYG